MIASSDCASGVKRYWQYHWSGDHPQAEWFDDMPSRNHRKAVARLGSPDLYVAGFPCPAFSAVGLQQGITVKKGQMIFKILAFLRVALPRLVVLENVGGLQSRHKQVLDWVLRKLRNLPGGYQVHHSVLDSAEHGVPHSRHRLWIVAIRNDTVIIILFISKLLLLL